jgi:hypothetical protein
MAPVLSTASGGTFWGTGAFRNITAQIDVPRPVRQAMVLGGA